jgi:protein-tyrosine phosphatase
MTSERDVDLGRRAVLGLASRWAAVVARIERRLAPPAVPPPAVSRILVLCEGNLCRSPFAEELLRARLKPNRGFTIESAGLRAAHGSPAPPLAQAAAARHGISLADHRSRPLTAALVESADWILVMDLDQRRRLIAAHRQSAGKVELLARYDPDRRASIEITDPMFGGDDLFVRVYARIEAAVEGLAAALAERREELPPSAAASRR